MAIVIYKVRVLWVIMPDWWDWDTYYLCAAAGLIIAVLAGLLFGLYLTKEK